MQTSSRLLGLLVLSSLVVLPPAQGSQVPDAASVDALRAAAVARGIPSEMLDVAHPGAPPIRTTLARAYAVTVGSIPDEAALDEAATRIETLGERAARGVAIMLEAMTQARALRDLAFAGVDPDDVAFVRDTTLGVSSPDRRAAAAAIIGRIDGAAMLRAAAIVRASAEASLPLLATAAPASVTCTPMLLVCVGTDGDDVWEDDVQLLIDPGGDDLYLNNAGGVLNAPTFAATGGCVFGGGTTGKARPNLGCTPAPSAVCTYDAANRATGRDDLPVVGLPGHADPDGSAGGDGSDGSCGSDDRRTRTIAGTTGLPDDPDSRGVAALLDLDGSDTYTVPWDHHDPLFGLIEDCYPGEQDRVNTNRDLFQGSALAGVGLLWDAGAGDDRYRGRLNAQASGHVGGVGMLITTGSGDAVFWADRLSQGNGIAGGVGVLVNTKDGDHTYLLDAPVVYRNEFAPNGRGCAQEGRAGQGEGGFGGVGVLWNQNAGTAVYRAVTHRTQNAYPYAPILRSNGAPDLVGGGDAQGSGESFPIVDTPGGIVVGVGLLLDATDGDASVCPARADGAAAAGMRWGSTTSTGIDLSTMGRPGGCGKFNLPPELEPFDDLGSALQHLLGGAVGVRVVL